MGGGKRKKQITGYNYSFDILMGLCRGPVDSYVEIRANDQIVWQRSGPVDGVTYDFIYQDQLFGGDKAEGGIVGDLWLMPGQIHQIVPDQVKTSISTTSSGEQLNYVNGIAVSGDGEVTTIKSLISDFWGVATAFFSGQIAANNPYIKPWKFRVRRSQRGWDTDQCWYPEKATIVYLGDALPGWNAEANIPHLTGGTDLGVASAYTVTIPAWQPLDAETWWSVGDIVAFDRSAHRWKKLLPGDNTVMAMNPAHIIYQCLTDKSWGRGYSRAEIDNKAFVYAANMLYDEGFGLSLKWQTNQDIDQFIQSILDHITGVLFTDRLTGLIRLVLIRADYDPTKLPLFDYNSGLLSVDTQDNGSSLVTCNEVIVQWHDPRIDEQREARAQNLASLQANTYLSVTKSYPGICDPDVAYRVALRDLSVGSAGLRRLKLKLDRRGWLLHPGAPIRISAPDKELQEIIVRVVGYDDGTLENGTITLDAVQDVFGMPWSTFTTPPKNISAQGNSKALDITRYRVDEADYLTLARSLEAATLDALAPDEGVVVAVAGAPTPTSKHFDMAVTPTGGLTVDTTGGYSPYGVLASSVGFYDTTIHLSTGNKLSEVTSGTLARLGNELVRVDSVDETTGTIGISRGASDTIPVPHSTGESIFFHNGEIGAASSAYAYLEDVDVSLRNMTATALSSAATAPHETISVQSRFNRPYLPGDLRLNGVPCLSLDYISVRDTAAFTWASRNRLTQADQIVVHTDGAVAAEAGTTYIVSVYDDVTGTLLRIHSGITGSSYTYDTAEATSGVTPDPPFLRFWITASRGGIGSYFLYSVRVAFLPTGMGLGKASGKGTASATSKLINSSVGAASASSVASATAEALGLFIAVGVAVGSSTADAVGRTPGLAIAVGHAASRTYANASGGWIGPSGGVGDSPGTGSAVADGSGLAETTGSASGSGEATGLLSDLQTGVGSASGVGTADAYAVEPTSVGEAAGTGSAAAEGTGINRGVGSAAASGVATAEGSATTTARGSATGTGQASALTQASVLSVGSASGIGVAYTWAVVPYQLTAMIGSIEINDATGTTPAHYQQATILGGVDAYTPYLVYTATAVGNASGLSSTSGRITDSAASASNYGYPTLFGPLYMGKIGSAPNVVYATIGGAMS